jgi:hypothetical protein
MEKFMKMEEALAKENEDLISKLECWSWKKKKNIKI